MAASLLLSRVLGLLRGSVLSALFGIGLYTDAYRLAFTVPDAIFYLVAGGALSSAFIPVFSELLHTDREKEAWELFSVVVTIMSIAVIVLIAAAWIFSPQLLGYIAHGKDPSLLPLIVRMSRIVLPAQFAFFIGGLMLGTLYSYQRFSMPGLAPNIYNIGIILGAVIISNFVSPGIVGASWGALIGAFAGNILLPLWAILRIGGHYRPSLNVRAEGVKRVFILMLPVVLGLSLPAVYAIIMQKFASTYAAGINTAIDFSNQLMQAPLGIFGQSLALAAFPALAQFFAQKRMDLFRNQIGASLRTVLYLSLPASFLLAALAPEVVQLIYGYGKTAPEALPPVWICLRYFCIGIFAWCIHPVLMRGFYAMHKSLMPVVVGTLTTFLFIGLYFVFRPMLGYAAMPLAGSLAAIVMVVALALAVYRETQGFDLKSVVTTLVKSGAVSAVVGGLGYGAFHFVPHLSRLKMLFAFLIVFCLCSWVYYFLTRALGMPETEYVARAMRRRRRPPNDLGTLTS